MRYQFFSDVMQHHTPEEMIPLSYFSMCCMEKVLLSLKQELSIFVILYLTEYEYESKSQQNNMLKIR
jgi:hypothetical protein